MSSLLRTNITSLGYIVNDRGHPRTCLSRIALLLGCEPSFRWLRYCLHALTRGKPPSSCTEDVLSSSYLLGQVFDVERKVECRPLVTSGVTIYMLASNAQSEGEIIPRYPILISSQPL